MYVDTSHRKTYTRYLLRNSFRENGKVKHRTIASLSSCSQEEIDAIKLALKHKGDLAHLVSIKQIKTREGLRIGAVYSLKVIAERIGLTQALGNDRQGKLALWQVMARCIDHGSRLSAVRLAESHAVCDVLGLEAFNEDHLYGNLAWLAERQPARAGAGLLGLGLGLTERRWSGGRQGCRSGFGSGAGAGDRDLGLAERRSAGLVEWRSGRQRG